MKYRCRGKCAKYWGVDGIFEPFKDYLFNSSHCKISGLCEKLLSSGIVFARAMEPVRLWGSIKGTPGISSVTLKLLQAPRWCFRVKLAFNATRLQLQSCSLPAAVVKEEMPAVSGVRFRLKSNSL